jgi:hypothetical protein
MTSDRVRRERVAAGSRRKRDLVAVNPRFDYESYAAQHFPDERFDAVRVATFHVYMRHHKRKNPDPQEVRVELERRGWLREGTA